MYLDTPILIDDATNDVNVLTEDKRASQFSKRRSTTPHANRASVIQIRKRGGVDGSAEITQGQSHV